MNKIIIFAVVALMGGGVAFFAMDSVDEDNQKKAEEDVAFEISGDVGEGEREKEEKEVAIEKDDYGEIETEEDNQDIKGIEGVQEKEDTEVSFIECLANEGVVIYGSKTCPACARLSGEYEGYDNMELIYVECTEDYERCNDEMLVGYVPAIQINGEIYDGWGSPENLAKETGCTL